MAKTRIKNIIFHWSASASTTTVDDIRGWHLRQGWRDIGYHRVILHPDSVPGAKHWYDLVKQGRDLDMDRYISDLEVGAHAKGFNINSVGVCVVGGPRTPLHPLQKEAILQVAKIFTERFGLWRRAVICHRDVNKTQCPGDEIYNVIKQFKK
jgi:hypothetical protein